MEQLKEEAFEDGTSGKEAWLPVNPESCRRQLVASRHRVHATVLVYLKEPGPLLAGVAALPAGPVEGLSRAPHRRDSHGFTIVLSR